MGLLIALLIVTALRLPTFLEPYWYGDEGIYLAIGQAVQRGATLYRDIWDNKTPLLYLIYAINPTLLWAKISATVFVLGTVCVAYKFAEILFEKSRYQKALALLISLITGIMLSLPLLEGTIANAELYFTFPIILGAYLIYFKLPTTNYRLQILVLIGLLASTAFLIKVPALFDFLGMFVFILAHLWSVESKNLKKYILSIFKTLFPLTITFLIPITGFFIYFYFQHALNDYLIAAFSQNASYVAVDTGPLAKLSNPLFIKAFWLLLTILISLVLFFKKWLSKELLFLALWFGFSLYGALLSGRPYMHYLLQVVPPTVLLLAYLLVNIKKFWYCFLLLLCVLYLVAAQFINAFSLPIIPYYQNWFNYVSEKKSWEEYVTFFDSRTLNSYEIADYIMQNTKYNDSIFVWGDAAFVYVLSNRAPATKFIQAHHLTTIDSKNFDLIIKKLVEKKVKYILVSRPVGFSFPKLEELLTTHYKKVIIFEDMNVYQIK